MAENPEMQKRQKAAVLCCRTTEKTRNWSELPQEILESILERLALVDLIRFVSLSSGLYHSAKSYGAAPHYKSSRAPQSPWLLLPKSELERIYEFSRKELGCDVVSFFSLTEKKVYTFKNLFEGRTCIGSSHGWLVLLDVKTLAMCLLNPISRIRIELPVFPGPAGIVKVVLSSDPSPNSNFYVVVDCCTLPCKFFHLAIYKHNGADYRINRNNTWKSLTPQKRIRAQEDMIFHNEHLFVLTTESIQVWDFMGGIPIRTMDVQLPRMDTQRLYFVESEGELLLVHKYTQSCYVIYKQNFTVNKWEEVECLPERAIISSYLSVSTRNFPGLEANSIYTTPDIGALNHMQNVEVMVCNLGNRSYKSIKSYYKFHSRMINTLESRILWFHPRLDQSKRRPAEVPRLLWIVPSL